MPRVKLLLATDGSEFSDAALRIVASQYRPEKTDVQVLHVVQPVETFSYAEFGAPYPIAFENLNKERLKQARNLTDKAARILRSAGFQAEGMVRLGNARDVILDVAAKWHAAFIVLGSHGDKGLGRFLLGSTSDSVARHANCSVVIIRKPRRKRK